MTVLLSQLLWPSCHSTWKSRLEPAGFGQDACHRLGSCLFSLLGPLLHFLTALRLLGRLFRAGLLLLLLLGQTYDLVGLLLSGCLQRLLLSLPLTCKVGRGSLDHIR